MKTILFPTDFSKNANDALNYAIEVATLFHTELILFNSYPIPVYMADMPVDTMMNHALKTESENKLNALSSEIKKLHPEMKINCASNWGFASDEIVTAASDLCADLIIMGTKGASGLRKIFMGSNTASVISKAHCPVLAIPEGVNFKAVTSIAFASDCMEDELAVINRLYEWIEKFNSKLTLVHIEDGILSHNFEDTVVSRFKEKVGELYRLKNVEYSSIDAPDFVNGINKFLLEGSFDLLAMAHHSRNFIEQILSRSHATQLAYHLVIPLLMIPVEKNRFNDKYQFQN